MIPNKRNLARVLYTSHSLHHHLLYRIHITESPSTINRLCYPRPNTLAHFALQTACITDVWSLASPKEAIFSHHLQSHIRIDQSHVCIRADFENHSPTGIPKESPLVSVYERESSGDVSAGMRSGDWWLPAPSLVFRPKGEASLIFCALRSDPLGAIIQRH